MGQSKYDTFIYIRKRFISKVFYCLKFEIFSKYFENSYFNLKDSLQSDELNVKPTL